MSCHQRGSGIGLLRLQHNQIDAEDNNDVFYWLLDIGERNRRAIRHLEFSWAYGVTIQTGRENIYDIIDRINNMKEIRGEKPQQHREQLIKVVRRMEQKTVRLS